MSMRLCCGDVYDINKNITICRDGTGENVIDDIYAAIDHYLLSLKLPNLTTRFDEVVSGRRFKKTKEKRHIVEITHGRLTMRMVSSVWLKGRMLGLFSYEQFAPKPLSQDFSPFGDPIVEVILASLERMDEAEFFLSTDELFDYAHNRGIAVAKSFAQSDISEPARIVA